MAVDIKQLRVGSHVEVNGVRARVIELVEKHLYNLPWAMYAATIDGEYRTCGGFLQNAEPIAITPELLVEFGFVYHKYDNCKLWEMEFKDGFHSHLNLEYDDERNCFNLNCWDCKELVVDIHCEFLHELENWVYLVYGKALIEE